MLERIRFIIPLHVSIQLQLHIVIASICLVRKSHNIWFWTGLRRVLSESSKADNRKHQIQNETVKNW